MRRALILSLVSICLTAICTSQAQAFCLPHDDAVAKLFQLHGESARGLGLGDRGHSMLELFVSKSGSWTILMTRTNGLSCIMAYGQDWMPGGSVTETKDPPA